MRHVVFVLFLFSAHCSFADVRSFDGTGNNEANPGWGGAGTRFSRTSPAMYPDGVGDVLRQTPNPRAVSNELSSQVGSILNTRNLTGMVWQWGQFLDHDITLSINAAHYGMDPILAPDSDPDGMMMIPFNRTQFDPATGVGTNPREQINSISSYIDASNVYGSDAVRAAALRTFEGGRLKTSEIGLGLLPADDQDAALASQPNDDGGLGAAPLFVAGDIRANEQPGLIAMHTIFLREHNRLADQLADLHVSDDAWNDERIYQTARRIVGAEIQAITYGEFLPAIMGTAAPSAVAPAGYQSDVNASILNEFATAIFRFGHSMLDKDLLMMDDDGSFVDAMRLREVFFQPEVIMEAANPDGVLEELLMGLSKQIAQDVDAKIVDDVRSFLFAPNGLIGLDLAALNIQRGRDHGIPDYNTLRAAFGLSTAADIADLTSDVAAQETLRSLYGDVSQLDAWAGALVEDHLPGSSFGPLIQASMIDQFERLRDGDRFFYSHDAELQAADFTDIVDLDNITLSQIIMQNSGLNGMAGNVFVVPEPTALCLFALGLVLLRRLAKSS